jgi:hypothetical protein
MATKLIQTKIRISADVKSQLEAAARRNKNTFNAECASRIGKTFAEERVFGGPDGRHIVNLLASSFMFAGQRAAGDRKTSQWINDPAVYREAVLGVLKTLEAHRPAGLSDRDWIWLLESAKNRFMAQQINTGQQEASPANPKRQRAGG